MRVLLCGLGNLDRGDDGFGPYIIKNIEETEKIKKLDCGLYPENYLNKMVSSGADLVIFLDTVRNEKKEPMILRNEEIMKTNVLSVSTHTLPFSAVYQFLREGGIKDIIFLGVPPSSYTEFTPKTKELSHKILEALKLIDGRNNLDIMGIYEILSTAIQ